jgi:hypothetical protein
MKSFAAGSGYLLRHARLEVRLIYTAFLALVFIGMTTTAAFQLQHIGPTPARITTYYLGGDRGGEMSFGKSFRELIEITHFHAFIMGIVYLVLAHLFVATAVSPRVKITLITLAFGGLAGDLAAPWLIRYVAGAFAYLELGSWLCEWVGFGGFLYVPMQEMWFRYEREEFPPE